MAEPKRRYKVQIADKTYTIIAPNSAEHVQAVVKVVEGQLNEIKEQMPSLDPEQAAILVALNAVSDQLAMQKKYAAPTTEEEEA